MRALSNFQGWVDLNLEHLTILWPLQQTGCFWRQWRLQELGTKSNQRPRGWANKPSEYLLPGLNKTTKTANVEACSRIILDYRLRGEFECVWEWGGHSWLPRKYMKDLWFLGKLSASIAPTAVTGRPRRGWAIESMYKQHLVLPKNVSRKWWMNRLKSAAESSILATITGRKSRG